MTATNPSLIALIFLSAVIVGISGQRNVDPCHFQAIHDCIQPLFYFSHRERSTGLVTNGRDHALLCRSLRNVTDCVSNFLGNCGTQISIETYDLINEVYLNNVREFCKAGPMKKNYLKHASCLSDNVHGDASYKSKCIRRFQATLDQITENAKTERKLGASCCAYRFWMECATNYASDKCSPGDEASRAYSDYINTLTGGMLELVCGGRRYGTSTRFCRSVLAPESKAPKGRRTKSPISKYFTMFFPHLSY